MFNVKISLNFDTVVQKNILFFIRFFMELFPIAVLLLRIWSPHAVLYCSKHFYSILTNLSNLSHSKSSIVPFAKFRSDLKNVLTKHFPTMQPFANVLQNSSSYKFSDIRKIISVLESLLDKVTRLMACNFIKK